MSYFMLFASLFYVVLNVRELFIVFKQMILILTSHSFDRED